MIRIIPSAIAVIGVISLLFYTSCTNSSTSAENGDDSASKTLSEIPGAAKYDAYCQSCHNADVQPESRQAPPMHAIKKRYERAYETEEAFRAAIIAFLKDPSEENAKMKNAINKFGIMPAMAYPDEELELIANFIYTSDFGRSSNKKDIADMKPKELGMHLASSTKSALGKNLMKALQDGGPVHALDFCNTRAIPFTDSVATAMNASIKRVSDKPRNPNNSASDAELSAINSFKELLAAGEKLSPMLEEEGNGYRFYAPITTNAMCLKCHGVEGDQITPETTQKIAELYPNDQATGYEANQVRGIWSIYFETEG